MILNQIMSVSFMCTQSVNWSLESVITSLCVWLHVYDYVFTNKHFTITVWNVMCKITKSGNVISVLRICVLEDKQVLNLDISHLQQQGREGGRCGGCGPTGSE